MDKMKLAALGERLKIGGERLKVGSAEIGKMVSGKMKEILQSQSQEAKMVDEATSESLEEPNWGLNLRICNLLNSEEFDGSEVARAIKKKIACKSAVSQQLCLDLLEACAMNCDKVFSALASEKVLDELVRMIDNPQTHNGIRRRAFQLIEAWGKSDDLDYLPVFKQTYMSLKQRKEPASLQDNGNSTSLYSSLEPGIDEHEAGVPEGYPFPSADQQSIDLGTLAYHGAALSVEEKKEFLVITRNSIEILSSLLNTEAQEKPIKDDLMLSMVENCRESQPMMQRIIESIGDDEPLLFEALNLHEDLQQVLSKYEELDVADTIPAPDGQVSGDAGINDGHGQKGSSPSDGNEADGQKTVDRLTSGVTSDNKSMEKCEH